MKRKAAITMVMEHGAAHRPKNTDATYKFIVAYCQVYNDTRIKNGSHKLTVRSETAWRGSAFDHTIDRHTYFRIFTGLLQVGFQEIDRIFDDNVKKSK